MYEKEVSFMGGEKETVFYLSFVFLFVTLFAFLSLPGNSFAKEKKIPEDFVMSETGDAAPVVLSHKNHTKEQKLKCVTCHPKVFKMKKGKTAKKFGALTMAAMEEGKYCGKCHDGKEVFGVKDEKECVKCHVKK
jgi:c(7)-type cytochrome triheme protein